MIDPASGHVATSAPLARSYLYVPADQARFLDNAHSCGADAVILDLEDGVAHARKAMARKLAAAWLADQHSTAGEIWVRISGTNVAEELELARFPSVTGIVLPKAFVESVRALDLTLTALERERAGGASLQVIPLLETAVGLQSVAAIAALPRVSRFGIGRADLLADLGIDATSISASDLVSIWMHVVVASAASGIDAPIAPVETTVRRDDGDESLDQQLESTTQRFLALGFRARTAIHPRQVAIINRVFTPSAAEIRAARERVEWFDAANREGAGVVVDATGTIVDEAVIRAARQILRRARRGGVSAGRDATQL